MAGGAAMTDPDLLNKSVDTGQLRADSNGPGLYHMRLQMGQLHVIMQLPLA